MNNPDVKPLAQRIDDEGELTFIITEDSSGQIIIDFGKPVHWIAMPKKQAQELALLILRKAADRHVTLNIPESGD